MRAYYRCKKRQWKKAEEVCLYLYWRITDSCTSHRLLSCSLCRVTGLWVLFKPQAWASWIGLKALHLTSTVHTVSQGQQSKKQRQRDGEKKRDQGSHERERKAKAPRRIPRSWVLACYCSSNIYVFDSNLKNWATKLSV